MRGIATRIAVSAAGVKRYHVHLVVIPEKDESLASTLRPVHLRYTQWINRRRGETGVLWQGRYFSCPLDDDHYPWSSAAAHCRLVDDELLADFEGPPIEPSEWAAWLEDPDDASMLGRLRQRTRTGRPAGSDAFIERTERAVGRVLRLRKAGRPREVKST